MTTKTRQIVHQIPSILNYKYNSEKKIVQLNTEHFHTAQTINRPMEQNSIQSQAQQLHEQRQLQRQMKRLTRAADDYKLQGQVLVDKRNETKPSSGNWPSWLSRKVEQGVECTDEEILGAPVRLLIKIAVATLLLFNAIMLVKCGLICRWRAGMRWRGGRVHARQMAAITADGRPLRCRHCGAHDHVTADCTPEDKKRSLNGHETPRTNAHVPLVVAMATLILAYAPPTAQATPWPINTPYTRPKVESPTIRATISPRSGREVSTDAITDTGASVSVRPKKLAMRFGWLKAGATTEARQPLSLIGVGQKQAERFVEGALRIGNTAPPTARLRIAPINLGPVFELRF